MSKRTINRFVVGIDPGGRTTGVVVRLGRSLVDHGLIVREKDARNEEPYEQFGYRCGQEILRMVGRVDMTPTELTKVMFHIERVLPPSWHMGNKASPANPKHIVEVSLVAGIIGGLLSATFSPGQVAWVRPNGHGSAPKTGSQRILDAYMHKRYPSEILPKRDGVKYQDALRHARSAWDISNTPGQFLAEGKSL